MPTQEKLIKNKLGLLELAAYLKNVSRLAASGAIAAIPSTASKRPTKKEE